MTTVLDDNVFNIAVKGTFDDCQGIMKEIFRDLEFKGACSLGTVNSINWARVLAQIVYYFYSAFRVQEATGAEKVRFSVPTGNFGDILAGYIASRMGLPVGKLVLATNENDILSRFFNSGEYSLGTVVETISPSMDIQVASNFERYLYYKTGEDGAAISLMMDNFAESGSLSVDLSDDGSVDNLFAAGCGTTASTLETIRKVYAEHGYLLDPHTAVGVNVGLQHCADNEPMIYVSTAHPAKFSKAIKDAVGEDLAHHDILDGLAELPARCEVLSSEAQEVRRFITDTLKS